MLTQAQFDKLPNYDQSANPEKLEKPEAAVKFVTIMDFSQDNIYYRDADGVLSLFPRKLVKGSQVALGDVITFSADRKPIAQTSVVIDGKAKTRQTQDGQPARTGSNNKQPFSLF